MTPIVKQGGNGTGAKPVPGAQPEDQPDHSRLGGVRAIRSTRTRASRRGWLSLGSAMAVAPPPLTRCMRNPDLRRLFDAAGC